MGQPLRVFSPSSTTDAGECLRKWILSREGWKPRIIYYPELCAVLGDGFSESMRVLNEMKLAGVVTYPVTEIIQAGTRTMAERLAAEVEAGRRINDSDLVFSDTLALKLDQAVNLYMAKDPLREWTIRHAEKTYEHYGKCRIDVLAEDAQGPAVFDYKLKVKLDPRYEDKIFADYGRSQQRFHYQWAAGVKRFFIILVVLAPKPYIKMSPPYGESAYFDSGLWVQDARQQWRTMEAARETFDTSTESEQQRYSHIPGSPIHETKYGPCQFENACLLHALDPAAMVIEYVKTERRHGVPSTPVAA